MSKRVSLQRVSSTQRVGSDRAAVTQMLMPFRGRQGSVEREWQFKPGFLYTTVRAISARINQNFDGWPSDELKKSYRSFIGKPIFVNHQNHNPKKARGKVVAARYVESNDDRYIETVMEVDAARFPKLAHEIVTGGLDSVSMGVEAGFTICSYCDHKAYDEPDFCDHVRFHKGRHLQRTASNGETEDVLVYEKCHKLSFFELSYVFDPADETAVVSRVISANKRMADQQQEMVPDEIVEGEMPMGTMPTASRRRANGPYPAPPGEIVFAEDRPDRPGPESDRPQLHHLEANINRIAYGEIEAPAQVDTLRDDESDFKHYVDSPKELRDPDMDRTKRLDREQGDQGLDADRRAEDVESVGTPVYARHARTDKESRMARNRNRNRQALRRFAEGEDALIDEALDALDFAQDSLEAAVGDDGGDEFADDGFGGGGDEFGGGFAGDDGGFEDDHGDDDSGGFDDRGDDDGFPGEEFGDDDEDDDSQEEQQPQFFARKRARKQVSGGLSERHRVASRGQRRHYAESSEGYVDGGPYHVDDNDEGVQEDEFISDVPGAEAAALPDGASEESNSSNHVARALAARIQRRNADLKRDLIAYEQVTGKRIATRRTADDGPPPQQPLESTDAVEFGDVVNPSLDSTGAEDLRGDDFTDVGLAQGDEHPDWYGGGGHDRESSRAFQAFDRWLQKATGRTANAHGSAFLRRSAARYCQATRTPVESLFPTLGVVLRQARVDEKKRWAMRKRAEDTKMEVAAPGDRIDVEEPVANTTDERAQASQFARDEFGRNAGDDLANPVESSDSQIWAPGESPSSKNANRKADGITAVRYAEAYIAAGLAPNTPEEKWKIAGLAQMMRHGTIVDRIRLLDAVNTTRRSAARRTAGVSRGQVPPGVGRGRIASTNRTSAVNDVSTDSALFFKG